LAACAHADDAQVATNPAARPTKRKRRSPRIARTFVMDQTAPGLELYPTAAPHPWKGGLLSETFPPHIATNGQRVGTLC
jgi:hypothetical protein